MAAPERALRRAWTIDRRNCAGPGARLAGQEGFEIGLRGLQVPLAEMDHAALPELLRPGVHARV